MKLSVTSTHPKRPGRQLLLRITIAIITITIAILSMDCWEKIMGMEEKLMIPAIELRNVPFSFSINRIEELILNSNSFK